MIRVMGLGTDSMVSWSASKSSNNPYSTTTTMLDRVMVVPDSSSMRLSGSLFPSLRYSNRSDCRHFSQLVKTNGKRAFLVDTLALVFDLLLVLLFVGVLVVVVDLDSVG